MNIKKFILGFTLSIMLFSCNSKIEESESLPFYNDALFNAKWIKKGDAEYPKIHSVANFSFQNQDGKSVSNVSFKNHIYVANFFFSVCPSICPRMMSNLAELQEKFKDENGLKMVSFSVTPWIDTVEKLHEYGQQHHINSQKWYLLTGKKEEIYDLARKSFFAEKTIGLKKSNSDFLHTEAMLLIDKQGRIRGVYNATQKTDIERVAADIDILLNEQ